MLLLKSLNTISQLMQYPRSLILIVQLPIRLLFSFSYLLSYACECTHNLPAASISKVINVFTIQHSILLVYLCGCLFFTVLGQLLALTHSTSLQWHVCIYCINYTTCFTYSYYILSCNSLVRFSFNWLFVFIAHSYDVQVKANVPIFILSAVTLIVLFSHLIFTTNNYRNSDGKIARGLVCRQWRRTGEGKLRRQMEKQISDGMCGRQSVVKSFYFFKFFKNT